MPYVKRTAAGRISAVFDRPSLDAKECVRANDSELLKFLGRAPTQSASPQVEMALPEPAPSFQYAEEEVPSYEWAEESETYPEPPAVEPTTSTVMPPEVPEPVAEASGAELGTDFSLPDDMPEDIPEDYGFAEGFDLPEELKPPAPASVQTPAEEPNEGAPVLEYGDMPAQQSTDAPTAGQSPSALTASAAPPPEQFPEESGDASNKKEGEVDDSALQQLDASDLEMARITGDLIDLLIGRDIINFTDFPGMARSASSSTGARCAATCRR